MYPDSLSALLAALYRRRLTVVLVLAGSLAGGVYYTRRLPPTYLARSVVFVPQQMPRLSLNSELANLPAGPPLPDVSEATRVAMTGLINSGAIHRRVMANNPDLPAQVIRKSIKGDIDSNQQLTIYALNEDARLAVRLANEFLRAFRERMREMVEEIPRKNLETFRAASEQAWRSYQEAVAERVDFLDSIQSVDLETEVAQLISRRTRLRSALEDLDLQERQLAAEREAVQAVLATRPDFRESRQGLARNPEYVQAVQQAAQARVDLAVQRLVYQPEHPRIQELMARIEQMRRQAEAAAAEEMVHRSTTLTLDAEGERLAGQLVDQDVQEASLAPRRTALTARLEETEAELAGVPFDRAELERLDRQVASRRQYAETLDRRIDELELQLARGLEPTYTDEDRLARLDEAKALPGTAGVLLFSSLAGLVVGLTLAIGLELLRTLRSRYPY